MSTPRVALVVALASLAWTLVACDIVGGPPPTVPPAPVVDCLAAPAETCATALGDALLNTPQGERVTRVRVTCSQPLCIAEAGVAQVDVWYSDGTIDSYSTEWAGAVGGERPPPVEPPTEVILPVVPTCVGLAFERCREMATSIIVPVGQTGRIVSILVSCTVERCDATQGQGTTRVTFEDGSSRVADWGYAGG